MKISTNEKFIARNKKIAQYTLYLSLALLVLGFLWSIRNTDPAKAFIGWAILVPSYFLVQLSIFMANKWGQSPRPDEIVVQSLKGLNDDYSLYNFTTAVPHLLVGPQGVWVINPYHQKGEISFDAQKSRYRQKGGAGIIGKFFGQEGLPKITRESANLKNDVKTYFNKLGIKFDEMEVVNLFFAENVNLIGKDFPDISIRAEKLKNTVRKEAKKNILPSEKVVEITKKLPQTE